MKFIILVTVPVIALAIATFVYANKPIDEKTGQDLIAVYEQSLDYSCMTASDCAVKNIGNCCGYSPACVNKLAKADADYVTKICTKSSLGGVCGFEEVTSCECKNNKCQNASLN